MVKFIKNCQICQNYQQKLSKFVIKNCHLKMSSTSLIKCLKGHKSLGSLCSDVKTLIVSLVGPTRRPSKGQGHLLSCCGQLKRKKTKGRRKRGPTHPPFVCPQTQPKLLLLLVIASRIDFADYGRVFFWWVNIHKHCSRVLAMLPCLIQTCWFVLEPV